MQRNSASVWLVFSDYTESIAQLSTLTSTKKRRKDQIVRKKGFIESFEKREKGKKEGNEKHVLSNYYYYNCY